MVLMVCALVFRFDYSTKVPHKLHANYTLTPQTARPPVTPSHSPPELDAWVGGDQLMLPTSKSDRQLAEGPLTLAPGASACPIPVPFALFSVAELPALIRSQYRTNESSPPEASIPRLEDDHSMDETEAECPCSSRSAWPGCRWSRMRMILESCAKVANKWESCGEAALVSTSFSKKRTTPYLRGATTEVHGSSSAVARLRGSCRSDWDLE